MAKRIGRGFTTIEYPELGASVEHPAFFAKSSDCEIRIRRRAPRIGEHNAEVMNEIGIAADELPGLAKEDVAVTIENGVLSISGEKKAEKEQKGRTYHRVERFYGSVHRAISLPQGVDASRAAARFENGVLTIELPKTEDVKPRTLKIS